MAGIALRITLRGREVSSWKNREKTVLTVRSPFSLDRPQESNDSVRLDTGRHLEMFEASGRNWRCDRGVRPSNLLTLHHSVDVLGKQLTLQAATESEDQTKISAFFTLAREILFDTLDIPLYLS